MKNTIRLAFFALIATFATAINAGERVGDVGDPADGQLLAVAAEGDRPHAADVGNQCHPDGRRDAGAVDCLHGDGAAADRRRANRPSEDQG